MTRGMDGLVVGWDYGPGDQEELSKIKTHKWITCSTSPGICEEPSLKGPPKGGGESILDLDLSDFPTVCVLLWAILVFPSCCCCLAYGECNLFRTSH